MSDAEPTAGTSPPAAAGRVEPPVLHSTRLPPATAALRDPVEDRPVRTGELRDALDELRVTLDTPPDAGTPSSSTPSPRRRRIQLRLADRPGGPPPEAAPEPAPVPAAPSTGPAPGAAVPPDPHRRRPVAVGVVALVVIVAAAAVGVAVAGRRPSGAGSAARSASPVAGRPSPGASVGSSVGPSPAGSPGAPPAGHPLPRPGAAVPVPPGLPRSGPGADAPGSELTAAIDADGRHVDVYERAVLRPGTTSVLLAPATTAGLPETLRDLRPSVEDLQAEVDGRPVAATPAGDGWQVAAPGGITQVVLRYRLGGALVRQEPAPPGRAGVLLRPLTGPAAQAAADPVVVRIDDRRVVALYCPAPRPALCAASAGTVLTATVPPGADAVVLADVTL